MINVELNKVFICNIRCQRTTKILHHFKIVADSFQIQCVTVQRKEKIKNVTQAF